MKPTEFLNELSNDTLASYKKKAGADATTADKEGDTKKADKRFSGIVKATKKQFANDEKKEVAEGTQRVDSLVTDALKIMRGAEVSDAVSALKTVLGDREYNGRRGHYNFYVKQMLDMYGQQGVAEGSEHYDGIEISMEREDDEIMVKAMMSGGRELGHVLFVIDGEYLAPQDLEVDERYQGQGIAATMYDYVKSKGYKIRRSGQQTDAGAGFWDKHKPGKNVWEQGVAEERTETKNEKGEVTSWRDESDWRKVSKDKDGRGRVTNLSDKARRETEKLKKEKSVDEGWKSAMGGAALAGAMALGGGAAHAQSGEDFLPDIVAHVTFKVNGNTVTKDINLGTAFKSPGQASAALEKFLKSKGIKYYEYSLERKTEKTDYLEKTPASDTGHSGSIDSGPYSSTGSSSDNYMAKESIEEAVARAVKSMTEDGYEFTEEKVRLDPKCWAGKKIGNPKTKLKGGVRVNNCVPK